MMIELLTTLILHETKNWDEVDINAYSRDRRMRIRNLKYSNSTYRQERN